jgi:hypothetical protein
VRLRGIRPWLASWIMEATADGAILRKELRWMDSRDVLRSSSMLMRVVYLPYGGGLEADPETASLS